jgi:3,4-dihydroxy 2-butanone 4-phosphate synthase/GTP cyclohydrolase II
MEYIAGEGLGVVAMLSQPMNAQQSVEVVERFPEPPGFSGPGSSQGVQNYRLIGTGSQILKCLGVGKMWLLSAPVDFNALSGFILEVT